MRAVVTNSTGCAMTLDEGNTLGEATPVTLICPPSPLSGDQPKGIPEETVVKRVQAMSVTERKCKLVEGIGDLEALSPCQRRRLVHFLRDHHTAFALEEHERGKTDLVEMDIDTNDADPRRCSPRRMPFAIRGEVARQLDHMQSAWVIQPSTSPWAIPVVMVRKRDSTHRFCIDYRQLNAVTKADTYPIR